MLNEINISLNFYIINDIKNIHIHYFYEFQVANIAGKKIIDGDKTTVNLDAIVEDFYILGAGLIRTIETK